MMLLGRLSTLEVTYITFQIGAYNSLFQNSRKLNLTFGFTLTKNLSKPRILNLI